MRAGIYLHIHDDLPPEHPKKQLQQMQALCAENGWEIFHIYRDHGCKARPAFQLMLDDARQGRFNVLVFWSLDWLQRGVRNTILLLHKLSTWKVNFCCCAEPHLDSFHEQEPIVCSILASLARQDHAYISERTRDGLKRQQQALPPGAHCMKPGRPHIAFNQERVLAYRAKKLTYQQIALASGVSRSTIQRFFKSREQGAGNRD